MILLGLVVAYQVDVWLGSLLRRASLLGCNLPELSRICQGYCSRHAKIAVMVTPLYNGKL
jgi:hypothetical protein